MPDRARAILLRPLLTRLLGPRPLGRVGRGSLGLLLASALLAAPPAAAETIEHQNLVLTADGGINPRKLPRKGLTGVHVRIAGQIRTTDGLAPPRLRTFSMDVNDHGRVFDRGLARCRPSQLRDATTEQALRACRDALVGRGHVSARVELPDQAAFPAEGTLLAFNARIDGRPAVLGHVFGTEPVPVTTVVPFLISEAPGRVFGARLTAILPSVAADWGYVAGFRMNFGRSYRHRGRKRSYLNAGCPAPAGFPGAIFDLARISYQFEGAPLITTTLLRECHARGPA